MSENELPVPEGLSERSQKLWQEATARRCRSACRLELLTQALRALDRAEAARRIIGREGMTTRTVTTNAVHAHPALKVEQQARGQFLRSWKALGLSWDPLVDGRAGP